MSPTAVTDREEIFIPVVGLLPEGKRTRFERYWREYVSLPSEASPEALSLQAEIAAAVMLPARSSLHPSTALAVATGLLQFHPLVGEGLASAVRSLTKLPPTEALRSPLDTYLTYALEELSYRFHTLARRLVQEGERSTRDSHANSG